MEPLLVWALVAVALAVLLRGRSLVLGALIVAAVAAGQLLWTAPAAPAANLPKPRSEGGYVTSDACRACHPAEYQSWHRSFHRTMTQAAGASATRAPFADETLVAEDDRSYRLTRKKDQLWADILGVGARRISLMTGAPTCRRSGFPATAQRAGGVSFCLSLRRSPLGVAPGTCSSSGRNIQKSRGCGTASASSAMSPAVSPASPRFRPASRAAFPRAAPPSWA